jgi:hypothetical protein
VSIGSGKWQSDTAMAFEIETWIMGVFQGTATSERAWAFCSRENIENLILELIERRRSGSLLSRAGPHKDRIDARDTDWPGLGYALFGGFLSSQQMLAQA